MKGVKVKMQELEHQNQIKDNMTYSYYLEGKLDHDHPFGEVVMGLIGNAEILNYGCEMVENQ